jgi:NADH:ubiquinone oxidoreductase subunit 5 (subunit L)/multisubunit Na+/H+ antiporter MnhA subunit
LWFLTVVSCFSLILFAVCILCLTVVWWMCSCVWLWCRGVPFFSLVGFCCLLRGKLFFLCLVVVVVCVLGFRVDYIPLLTDFYRFLLILLLFVVRMVVLILHLSVFMLFLGWDGLGITSYVLVAYYLNWSSLNGAMTTLLSNRLGDVCLFWFLCWRWYGFGYRLSFSLVVFLLGCATKRAQFPFRR